MDLSQEVAAYKAGDLELYELSPEARKAVIEEDSYGKFGWKPTLFVRAAGTTMPVQGKPKGWRQSVLEKIEDICTPDFSPSILLVPEPSNPYDEYAVKIFASTSKVKTDDYNAMEDVGFLPRGRCPGCGRTITGKTFDNASECPDCHTPLRDEWGQPIENSYFFNKFILDKMSQNKVKYAIDFVTANGPKGRAKRTLGLSLAFLIED
jgi:hypothetical protein